MFMTLGGAIAWLNQTALAETADGSTVPVLKASFPVYPIIVIVLVLTGISVAAFWQLKREKSGKKRRV